MTVVTVWSSTVVVATRPAVADSISSAQAKAAAIESQLAAAQAKMSALSQQYDAARYHLSQIDASIASTKASIAADTAKVAADRRTLSKAAIANYITDGSAANQSPIFGSNEKTMGAATEYSKIADGDISLAVANLHTAQNALAAEQAQLQGQHTQAASAVSAEQAAIAANAQAEAAQSAALAQEKGQIAALVAQQQRDQAAAAARAASARLAAVTVASHSPTAAVFAGVNTAAPPPTAAGGSGAVQAAESQIGVPYVWGGQSPKGSSNPGFDCSGLTAWAWGQVGVGLPHYSGAQMGNSAPVPLSNLQPGDLLFYGPGGSDHVAMYVGPGTMIEAPFTGSVVHLTGLRLGSGFVGAGRP